MGADRIKCECSVVQRVLSLEDMSSTRSYVGWSMCCVCLTIVCRRVLDSTPNSEWRKQRGEQLLTWQKCMKETMKRLGVVSAIRFPGWGLRDHYCALLNTLQNMAANECPLVQLILRGLHGHQRLRQDGFSFEFGSDSDANHSVIRLELKDNLYCGPTQARESFDSDSLFDPVVCWPSNRLWITSKPQGWNSTCGSRPAIDWFGEMAQWFEREFTARKARLKTLDVKSKSASSTPGFMRKLVGKARHSEEESDKNRHKLINFSLFKSDVMDAGAIEAEGNNGHVIDGCPKENRSHTNTDASTATQILSEEVANSTQNQIPKQWPELVYRIVHLPVCTSQSEPSDMSSTSISPLCKNSDASNRKLNGSIESLSVSLDAIKRKLVANVFCAWLSHMRLMRFVRKNLKCLVMPKSGVECPGTSGLTFERWSELFLQLSEEDRKFLYLNPNCTKFAKYTNLQTNLVLRETYLEPG
ncbi:hypothetical protein T265_00649 [Opisthorchis viverrini]|uniref:Uncharacterized protein n=1 Tax=Opisthorchis viverrini TaxID=6198 RepID=A0A075AJK4_OPIVI|nr:hypothetical protein T265_00649 [Opisthorchis viverrini]KER33539.1 hypothetical protein T265_00649 [Opisthorchis viverrini]